MRLRTGTTLLLTLALLAPAGSADAQDFEWSGRLADGQEVEVKGLNGHVRAERASGNEVVVTAEKRARRSDTDDVTIEVVEHADGVTICAVYPTPRRSRRENECAPGSRGRMNNQDNDVRVDFVVRVPDGVRFVGRTVNGGIEARGLRGDVEAYTVNGDVEVETSGFAQANTVNGSIEAELGRSDFSQPLDFETVNGSITVYMPDGLNADFSATTVNGSVETDFPITVRGRVSRRELRGTIGDGGPELEFRTVNGSIRLRRS